ncbi:MAG: helix-turn-helix transcriptional regulator [Clostridia bacterium]|nr:helix-turn-helix transcriptional regulator [Clostridia bacterium]
MEKTLGNRIAQYRREKSLTQEDLARTLNLSAQAVSKWENDQTCPDISLLPKLAEIFGITVDELLSGKKEPEVRIVPAAEQKKPEEMLLCIDVLSANGDRVRVRLPMVLIEMAIQMNMELPQITGNDALKSIDLKQVLELVHHGVMGNLVEVDSADGDSVRVFVE